MATTPEKIKLIVSESEPTAHVHPHKLHVELVDEQLKPTKTIAARLCGGTSTCLALVETE
jgi:hypothetical protein